MNFYFYFFLFDIKIKVKIYFFCSKFVSQALVSYYIC